MRLALIPAGLLVALLSKYPEVEAAPFHRNSVSSLGRPTSSFGLQNVINSVTKLPRGGSDEGEETTEGEVLYLPGLLDVELKKSSQVRRL